MFLIQPIRNMLHSLLYIGKLALKLGPQLESCSSMSWLQLNVIFGDLTSVAQDLMHYFDIRSWTTLITTLLLDHQKMIQFIAAENMIDHGHELGSNHVLPDSQADLFAVELSCSYFNWMQSEGCGACSCFDVPVTLLSVKWV